MKKYFAKICEYGFLLGIILFILLLILNTWTDYVIDERYLSNEILLVIILLFGFGFILLSNEKKE